VRYVGIDLAWGERARTGLAALGESGQLQDSRSVRTAAEITEFVQRHAPADCVVAIDAPLIVPNETGRRTAEALIGQRFGRFGASAYPANRTNPLFRPPRGAVLAEDLALDMDPARAPVPGRRTCIEVYPHPAMVALFELDYVIPYKAKQGRDLDALKAAYERLLTGIQQACSGTLRLDDSRRWDELCILARSASRKSELKAIEDEIDAIFCAYLAWLWAEHGLTACEVLGDVTTGYIVTPRM
jgi:predicted RNase H-like nuclease